MSGVILGGLALAGVGVSVYSSNKQAKAQESAAKRQEAAQREAAEDARESQRHQNQNTADVSGILQQNTDATLSGGSTLLTGAGGVTNDQLNLGKGNKLG